MDIETPSNLIEFMNQWQTLIGSALGPFLAIILAAIGFLIKEILMSRKERRESFRKIEVCLTNELNDLYTIKLQLTKFIGNLRKIVADSPLAGEMYYLASTNFPSCREVFLIENLYLVKTNSLYLHNQLNFISAGVQTINSQIKDLKDDFADVIRDNQFLIQKNSAPNNQRSIYTQNLSNFADAIKGFIDFIDSRIEMIIQTRFYNNELRKHPRIVRWQHESKSLKYFKNNEDFLNYVKFPNFLNRINNKIKNRTEKIKKDIDKRYEELISS